MLFQTMSFQKAVPVWQPKYDREPNYSLVFRTCLKKTSETVLRIAGHFTFTIRVNGTFVAVGPARAGRGYYRVDEYMLDPYLTEENNVLTIYVIGYNTHSYQYVNEPAFLCSEVTAGGEPVAWTGEHFTARAYLERFRSMQRFSFQRPHAEYYRFDVNTYRYDTEPDFILSTVDLAPVAEKRFIARTSPYGAYDWEPVAEILEQGTLTYVPDTDERDVGRARSIQAAEGKTLYHDHQFNSDQLLRRWHSHPENTEKTDAKPMTVDGQRYVRYCMAGNRSGLVCATVTCTAPVRIVMFFDEILGEGNLLDPYRAHVTNGIVYDLMPGTYRLMSHEPYTVHYLQVNVFGGSAELSDVGVRAVAFPMSEIKRTYNGKDPAMAKIFEAALQTFRQNAVDIYMDCPSRERAGWLCDSFFTSRVERTLTGQSRVETDFLANFIFAEKNGELPDGMLPMCYPSDHANNRFIPNWAMWYVLELNEYVARTGDTAFLRDAKTQMYALVDYFKAFENEDGLLQSLKSWVFVEWSECNNLVQDVNYPSNMLYSKMLRVLGDLYEDKELIAKGEALITTIRRIAKPSLMFCDNSVFDENGKLKLSGKYTETCQYYAFYCDVATPETDSELWNTLLQDFGPSRKENNRWKDVYFSNAFIGNYLRLDLLFRYGCYDRLVDEFKGYFLYMAERTGTLWEHDQPSASCNHGFASHVIYWMDGMGMLKDC